MMGTERDGAFGRAPTDAGWELLIGLMRRFTAEGLERRTALRQVMRAARLDAEETQALYKAVIAAEIDEEELEEEADISRSASPDNGAGHDEDLDQIVDALDSDEDDLDSLDEEEAVPDFESLRGTVRVDDMDAARRTARNLLQADRKRVNPHRRLLTAEEEVGLCLLFRGVKGPSASLPDGYVARLPRDGEAYRAFSAMVLHNQRLVHKIVQGLGWAGGPMHEDLVQHGMIGLMHAVEKFDVSMGCKLSTYATWWIRQRISRAVMNEGSAIRLPVHVWTDVDKVRRKEREFLDQGRKPNVDDLILACGLPPAKVEECLRLGRRAILSLDQPVGENLTLGELAVDTSRPVPGPEQALWSAFERQELFQCFDACSLTDRLRHILLLRFGFVDGTPWTLEQIGEHFEVTRERIRQLEKKALTDLRILLGLEPDNAEAERRRAKAAQRIAREAAEAIARRRGMERRKNTGVGAPLPNKSVGTPRTESGSDRREGTVSSQGTGFGRWLAERMRENGMDESQLADRLGVTRAPIDGWLHDRSVPQPELLAKMREILGAEDDAGQEPEVAPGRRDEPAETPAVWYHRPGHDDGGREFGNAAAFAFEADLEVLAREATQNSLDERDRRNNRPVRVRYTLHELTGDTLARFLAAIHWDGLRSHYEAAAAQDQKVGRVINAGLREVTEGDHLVLLRVDDYNANGLTGDDYEDGRFAAVVRRQLDSLKSDAAAGGSYGLGKATLWATSRLGLVLMNSTLSEPHEGRTARRVIGRLDLPWREVEGRRFAGPAWLGRPDAEANNTEVVRSWWADEGTVESLYLTREGDDPGTSFLIVGAHDVASLAAGTGHGEEDDIDDDSLERMHQRLLSALGRNFWAAMTAGGEHRPLLEASVRTLRNGVELLAEERVEPHEHQPARSRALQAFLSGTTVDRLTEAGQVARITVPLNVPARDGIADTAGEHRAVLLITDATDADGKINRVTAMRGNRMTVRTRWVPGLPASTNPFQAVLLVGRAAGDDAPFAAEAEEFLRASEPPEHNKWGQTEELRMRYSPSAHRRIAALTTATNRAVHDLVAIPKDRKSSGTSKVGKRLKITGKPAGKIRGTVMPPKLHDLEAVVAPSGAWQITAEVKVSPGGVETWRMSPVAKLDVRSGPRPVVKWAELVAVKDCELSDGVLHFPPGVRRAVFRGVTDISTHPVRAALTGLEVVLQESKGGGA